MLVNGEKSSNLKVSCTLVHICYQNEKNNRRGHTRHFHNRGNNEANIIKKEFKILLLNTCIKQI